MWPGGQLASKDSAQQLLVSLRAGVESKERAAARTVDLLEHELRWDVRRDRLVVCRRDLPAVVRVASSLADVDQRLDARHLDRLRQVAALVQRRRQPLAGDALLVKGRADCAGAGSAGRHALRERRAAGRGLQPRHRGAEARLQPGLELLEAGLRLRVGRHQDLVKSAVFRSGLESAEWPA